MCIKNDDINKLIDSNQKNNFIEENKKMSKMSKILEIQMSKSNGAAKVTDVPSHMRTTSESLIKLQDEMNAQLRLSIIISNTHLYNMEEPQKIKKLKF